MFYELYDMDERLIFHVLADVSSLTVTSMLLTLVRLLLDPYEPFAPLKYHSNRI